MNFYGFEARFGKRITVTRASNFAAKAAGWLSSGKSKINAVVEASIPPPFIGRYGGGFREPADLPAIARGC
jgi:hypothetical protein